MQYDISSNKLPTSRLKQLRIERFTIRSAITETKFGFAYRTTRRGHLLAVPFWSLTLLAAAAGTLSWMQRPYRFTLRGALVVTTLVAVVLGMGVAMSR